MTGENLCRFMMSAAQHGDLPPRSGSQHLRAKVPLPDGRQLSCGKGPGCWRQPAILGRCGGQAGTQTSALGLYTHCREPRSCTAKAGGSMSRVSKLTVTLASLSPMYLRSLNGHHRVHQLSWQLALVPYTQSMTCYPAHVLSSAEIGAFSSANPMPRKDTPASGLHASLGGSFFWQVLHLQGWGPGFDSSVEGHPFAKCCFRVL